MDSSKTVEKGGYDIEKLMGMRSFCLAGLHKIEKIRFFDSQKGVSAHLICVETPFIMILM